MNVSVNCQHFMKAAPGEAERSLNEALLLCAEAGFRFFDMATEDIAQADAAAAFMDENGLYVGQSHMPYNRYRREDYADFITRVLRCAECAHRMGSPILVVHADEFDFSADTFSLERAREFNVRLFAPLADFAAKHGMRIAFENVFVEHNRQDTYRYCSKTEELLSLLEAFPCQLAGICWDSGHAKMSYGKEHIDALLRVADRVIATHIHDNYYERDLHLPPFMGNCDWPAFMRALRSGGFDGNLSLELHYDRVPEQIAPEWVSWLYRSACRLSEM
ncbi:MAG: sugar phosphate isomerase/epimerase [Clostridia bacterium]|nr:sugar phosphate isomerase/epimerase [Clostridia bacterium]